jgi:hypothetical protein
VFRVDRSTITTGHAPENLAVPRNMLLSGLRAESAGTNTAILRGLA